MRYRPFKEWSKAGYTILKGSRATWHNGVAHFSEAQVRPRYDPLPPRPLPPPVNPSQYEDDMPSDAGSPVSDRYGRESGIRGYTKFNGGDWVPVTYHADGSSTVHCGGPCGPLYVDEFGNT